MVACCAAYPHALLALDSTDDCFVHAGDTHAHLKTHIIVALVEDIHTFYIFSLFWVVQKRRPKTFRSRTYLLFQSLHPGGHLRAGWEPCRSKLACTSGKDVLLGSTSLIYIFKYIYIHVCVCDFCWMFIQLFWMSLWIYCVVKLYPCDKDFYIGWVLSLTAKPHQMLP